MTTPIVDAHHHIWRRERTPWLMGPMVPRIFGEYQAIRRDGTQKNVLADMQTRDDLYKYLDYHAYERKLDALFSSPRDGKGEKSR